MNFDIFSNLFSNIWPFFLVILFFGGSIFIHELGHFVAAKRRGLKIERFSIGFGPKIIIWKKNGIEYCISLLPIGGYITLPQIAAMRAIEGNSGKQKLPPVSYASKIIVSSMGAIFNLIFAFILALISWGIGQSTSHEKQTTVVGHVAKTMRLDLDNEVEGPAFKAGIRAGDKILAVDGSEVNDFQDIQQLVLTGSGRTDTDRPLTEITVLRGSETLTMRVEPQLVQFNVASNDLMRSIGLNPAQSLKVKLVMPNSPAEKAGIMPDDVLLEVNNEALYSLASLSEKLKNSPNETVTLSVNRSGEIIDLPLKSQVVPFTKPLLKFEGHIEGKPKSIQFLPLYAKNEQLDNLASTTNPSTLSIFESQAPGTLPSDKIVSVNSVEPSSISGLETFINQNQTKPLTFNMKRNGNAYVLEFTPPFKTSIISPQTQAMLGIQLDRAMVILHTNPIQQFEDSIAMTFRTLGSLINSKSNVSLQNLMGPPGIIRTLHTFSKQDFRLLLWLVILLNINLAILNLLPIPVLDGGHILFFTIQKLRGKPLNPKFIASVQATLMVMLFGLMIYVSFFDIRRWQGDSEFEKKIQAQQSLHIPYQFSKS